MENLEEILKNKRNIIIVVGIIIILIIGGIGIFINHKNTNEENINILSKMEEEIEENSNRKDNKDNSISSNNIEINENIENEIVEEKIAIHITGEVKKTGILYLEKGSRIIDAIEMAGGATKNANLNQVNLAYILEDGQKIYIPNKKEKIEQGAYIATNSGQNVLVEEGKDTAKSIQNTKGVNNKVNINTANQTELETLQGIGPSLAQRIVDYRQSNGKFKKIEDIQNVKGIGNSKYSNIKDNICI